MDKWKSVIKVNQFQEQESWKINTPEKLITYKRH